MYSRSLHVMLNNIQINITSIHRLSTNGEKSYKGKNVYLLMSLQDHTPF